MSTTRPQNDTLGAATAAHKQQAQSAATHVKPKPQPAARFALLDWALLSLSLLLLVVIGSYLLHAAHRESHRLHHAPIFGDGQAAFTRRSRTIAQTPPAAELTPAAELPVGRRLLADAAAPAAAAAPNEFAPFDSAEHRDKMYAQWYDTFKVSSDKHLNAMRAFIEILGPAVANYNVHAAPLGSTNYCVAGFDGREDPDVIFGLRHVFHMLGMGPDKQANTVKNGGVLWSLVLWVTPENEQWFVDQLKIGVGLPGEHIKLIRASPILKRQASTIAASRFFYESIPCEHILYLQPDGLMLRAPEYALTGAIHNGPKLLDLMHNYVYLGAPWNWCNKGVGDWCLMGGNGGMSYRRRSVMLDLTREIACSDWRCDWVDLYPQGRAANDQWKSVEDTYFSRMLYERRHKYQGQIASQEQASAFAMETIPYPDEQEINPWFVHKIWDYIKHQRYIPIMSRTIQYYPELWKK